MINETNTDMKTQVNYPNNSVTIISGVDRVGVKEDFFEIHEEWALGREVYRVYSNGYAQVEPYWTFSTESDAIDACRKRVRALKILINERSNRPLELDL